MRGFGAVLLLAGVATLGLSSAVAQVTPENAGKLTLEALTARPVPPPRYLPVRHAASAHYGRWHATTRHTETHYRAVAQHPAPRGHWHKS